MPDNAPIADYSMLSDCHTAALLHRDGSIDWWCPERFDRPSWFARLLDPQGGHWSIAPTDSFSASRSYVTETMVVETVFDIATTQIRLYDGLAFRPGDRDHEIGIETPGTLFRVIAASDRSVEMTMDLLARPDFARAGPVIITTIDGPSGVGLLLTGGGRSFTLRSSLDLSTTTIDEQSGRLTATFTVDAAQTEWFTLSAAQSCEPGPLLWRETVAGWQSWNGHHDYSGWGNHHVRRSAMVLQSLTYGPTGALVAAPTTSLPEIVGGQSNWDYRYAWLRDATFNVRAFAVGACVDEADRYFGWLADTSCVDDSDPPVVVDLDGGRQIPESTLDHLAGWRSSHPVRIGNGAWDQLQLDVPGEILEAALLLRTDETVFDERNAAFLVRLADLVAERWEEPDSGIWEGRHEPRHYTSSKVMCWTALDRACSLAADIGASDRVARWSSTRAEIHRRVCAEAWDPDRECFTGAFGSDHLDASVMLIALTGFLDGDDPRMLSTLAVIERELTTDGLVLRWTDAEDEPFVMCSFWLAECWAMAGDRERAIEVFESVVSHANDVGLMAEEVSAATGELIGNFPQALSHAALINAAAAIDRLAPPG